MGKPGPAKTPTRLAVVRGERADRLNQREPIPGAGAVVPPDMLSAAALEVWHRLAPDLQDKGVLTAWDVDAFAVFCDSVARYREAAEALAETGLMVRGQKGELVKSPVAQIVRDTAGLIRQYAQEFGLTPSARTGLEMPEAEHDGEDLLTG